jgi:hypothetical protein
VVTHILCLEISAMNPPRLRCLVKLSAVLTTSLVLGFGFVNAQVSPTPTPQPIQSPAAPASTTAAPAAGPSPINFTPDKLNFGERDIGTTTYSQMATLKNNGKLPLRLNILISKDEVEFTVETPLPANTLASGAECLIFIKFTPIDAGTRDGELQVDYQPTDNSAASSHSVLPLTGIGAVPKLRLSQEALDFGSQVIGSTSLVRTLILTAGNEQVGGLAVATSGDFTATPVICPDLQPSASCALSVTFVPKSAGATTGALTILNDKTARKVLKLTGTGLESCNTSPDFLSWKWVFFVLPVILMVVIYLLALIFVRWNMIARPTRNLLIAEIGAVQQRVAMLGPPNAPCGLAQVSALLDAAQDLVSDEHASNWLDHVFWTRGQELAAWGYVHEAEEQLVFFLPEQAVRAELERVEGDLREAATLTAIGLADRIHEALLAAPPLPLEDATRQTLEEVLHFLTPQDEGLANAVSAALQPDAPVTIEQLQELASKVLGLVTPQAASIAERLNQAVRTPPATMAELTPLLEEAAKVLRSDALKLAAILEDACNAAAANPPKVLTMDDWKGAISKARDYLMPHASLISRINAALSAKPEVPLDRWRALHSEALGYLYNRSDTSFAALVSWQNKTVWLVGCSLLLIIALAATLQHGILFLVGATGGLMSRLTRSLSRDDVPTDYGASWSTLFLSPLIGALAGWSGILLVIVGVEFNILGSALKFDWCNTFNPVMLGIALLLGTSERFFDGILDQLTRKISTPSPSSPQTPPAGAIVIGTLPTLPEGKVGKPYSETLVASGGTPPFRWTLASGVLPAGLKLEPGGQISGKPTAKGAAKFTIQVADAAGKTQAAEFTLVIT